MKAASSAPPHAGSGISASISHKCLMTRRQAAMATSSALWAEARYAQPPVNIKAALPSRWDFGLARVLWGRGRRRRKPKESKMPRHARYIPHGVIPAVLLPFNDDL